MGSSRWTLFNAWSGCGIPRTPLGVMCTTQLGLSASCHDRSRRSDSGDVCPVAESHRASLSRVAEYRGAMDSIWSITSLIASGCLSGGYLYFTNNRLIEDRSFARTSSRTVQSVRNSAGGRIEAIRMQVGKRIAEVPASNFAAEGDVLVSAMGKGELKKAANDE